VHALRSTLVRPAQIPTDPLPAFDLQGHRGARGLVPENTLPSFRRALELGVTTLELDTVVSADGQVVVSHEPWMSAEICSHPDGRLVQPGEAEELNIFQMTYAEVAQFDCGIRGHARFPRQIPQPARKPLLREVFALGEDWSRENAGPPVFYNVETKSRPVWESTYCPDPETFVEAIWREVEAAGVARRFILQSFDPRTLVVAHERQLPIRLALLVEAAERGIEAEPHPLTFLETGIAVLGFAPQVYSSDHRLVTQPVVSTCHAHGIQVIPWTVNETVVMRHLQDLRVDGLITDYPDRGDFLLKAPTAGRASPSRLRST